MPQILAPSFYNLGVQLHQQPLDANAGICTAATSRTAGACFLVAILVALDVESFADPPAVHAWLAAVAPGVALQRLKQTIYRATPTYRGHALQYLLALAHESNNGGHCVLDWNAPFDWTDLNAPARPAGGPPRTERKCLRSLPLSLSLTLTHVSFTHRQIGTGVVGRVPVRASDDREPQGEVPLDAAGSYGLDERRGRLDRAHLQFPSAK